MTATTATLDFERPEALWGVGTARSAEGLQPYTASNRDIEADTVFAAKHLAKLGVTRGSLVQFVHNYNEMIQFWPLYLAAMRQGAVFLNSMATPYDVGRLEMYSRRFSVQAVIGPVGATVAGLKTAGFDPKTIFAKFGSVAAFSEAAAELAAAGLRPYRLDLVGPLLLMRGPDEEGGSLYDTREWTVEEKGGRLFVTASAARACKFAGFDTGVPGRVKGDRIIVG